MRKVLLLISAVAINVLDLSSAYGQYYPMNGVVAYYPFNGNANDESGNHHDGGVYGASPTTNRLGEADSAYHFDGVNDYIDVTPRVTTGNPFTWSIWFRPDYSQTSEMSGVLMGQGKAPYEYSPQLSVRNGAIQFHSYDSIARDMYSRSRPQWDTNLWHHVVVTADSSGIRNLYVNGQLESTATNIPYGVNSSLYNLRIGDNPASYTDYFTGDIDDVLIYNRSLSAIEVMQLYGFSILTQPQSQLGYWGKSVSLSVDVVNGALPYEYQWAKNDIIIPNATNSLLTLSNLQLADEGAYKVMITDATAKSITSENAMLTVNPAGVSIDIYAGVTIDGVVGQMYGIQVTSDLSSTNGWTGKDNVLLTEPTQIWIDYETPVQSQRYYRVVPGPISIP